jgi:hypothetical protein
MIVMGSTPLLIADDLAAFVFHAHFVASEIDVVEPKSGFVDGGRDNGKAASGATLQFPDGREVSRPAGESGVNVRDIPHAGYKVVGDKPLKLPTVHIVDKGKPMTVPVQ